MIINTNVGQISFTQAGMVQVEERWNLGKEQDVQYKHFSKGELFWGIYQQIIIPSRQKMDLDNDSTFRLFYIYEKENDLILYLHFDDLDEAELLLVGGIELTLDDAIEHVYNQIKNALQDQEFVKDIVLIKDNIVVPNENCLFELFRKHVFYSNWTIV